MLQLLAPEVDAIILTRAPTAPPERAWDTAAVLGWSHEIGLVTRGEPGGAAVIYELDFDEALEVAGAAAGTALMTGSFHTVGDALARLPGLAPLG